MLTLFSIPKPFIGQYAILQQNALTSWTLLQPRPEIIIFGNEEGIAEIVRKLDLVHVPDIRYTNYGTPILGDAFEKTQRIAKNRFLGYINADIILMNDFCLAVESIPFHQFLMGGQRWNADINGPWNFSAGWERRLRAFIAEHGQLYTPSGIDYFVFPRQLPLKLPPFAVGRIGWDNWCIRYARERRIPVVDATQMVMAVHQNHDYTHIPTGANDIQAGLMAWHRGPEALRNLELAGLKAALNGNKRNVYTLRDATWKLTTTGAMRRSFPLRGLLYRYLKRLP